MGDRPPEFAKFAMAAVGFHDTTNYHTVRPKAAAPQFLLLAKIVLILFSRAAGATHEARFFPYCHLLPSREVAKSF
jgi:hypothetical protein